MLGNTFVNVYRPRTGILCCSHPLHPFTHEHFWSKIVMLSDGAHFNRHTVLHITTYHDVYTFRDVMASSPISLTRYSLFNMNRKVSHHCLLQPRVRLSTLRMERGSAVLLADLSILLRGLMCESPICVLGQCCIAFSGVAGAAHMFVPASLGHIKKIFSSAHRVAAIVDTSPKGCMHYQTNKQSIVCRCTLKSH